MATVTGLTAERMLEIEAASIVSGSVDDNGDLILVRHDDTEINAGNVTGPEGPEGPDGPTSIMVVTSSTRPVAPERFQGLAIWETDTKLFWIWNGAAWVFVGGTFVCTSATRPDAPVKGMTIYETDTGNTLIYQSATTGWTPPWNVAWGEVGYAAAEDPQGGINSATPVNATGLSLTRTYVDNRRIKISCGWGSAYSTVAGDVLVVTLNEGGTILQEEFNIVADVGGNGGHIEARVQPSAGTHTYKVQYLRISGTGDITVEDAPAGGWIAIDDMGPADDPV